MMAATAGRPDMRDRHSLPQADFEWMKCLEASVRLLWVAYSADWG
jgi:hypothetical protein